MESSAVGVDIVEIQRVEGALQRFGERFLRRVYTPAEVALFHRRIPELAARFAAKEAVMKALGTGARGVAWREIEILPNRRGKPLVYLHGRAKERAERIGLNGLDISMSHTHQYAVAFAVGRSNSEVEGDRAAWRARLIGILRQRGALPDGPAAGEGPNP